ncbi:MAG: uroporphyrinogen-III decarboxylase-like protein [Chloroflexi bacterium]|nr:uroporphyrinogen-III decarboxylase-like protein [Chloroflexota bacterium]
MKDTMTPKERWLALLQGEKPDRIPMDYWGTEEATQKLMAHLGCDTFDQVMRRLHIDRPTHVHAEYVGPSLPNEFDMYGCGWQDIDYGGGVYRECIHHPLAQYDSVTEIERNYNWPSIDWFDHSLIPDQVRGREDYPIQGGGSEPFLRYALLRGLEQAMVDLALAPELVHYCLDKLFDFSYEDTRRIHEQIPGQVTYSYIAEDLGGQSNLLFSVETIREYLLPGMRRMVELTHEAGAYAFCHSDGAIRNIIPDLIEIGYDVLNPIQWRCPGMERDALKRDFGEHLIFHGGVDNQQTLAFGSEENVWREVAENIEILGDGGGYILAPCHNIQAVSPPENVAAMYEAGYELG